jgi:hypothetical protein
VVGSKATATFTSQSGKQEILTMRGNWMDTSADIVDEAMGGMSPPTPFLPPLSLVIPTSLLILTNNNRRSSSPHRPQNSLGQRPLLWPTNLRRASRARR